MKAPVIALIIGVAIAGSAVAQEMPSEHTGMDADARGDRAPEQVQEGPMSLGSMERRMRMHARMNLGMNEDMRMGAAMETMCSMMHSGMMRDGMTRDDMHSRMMDGGMDRRRGTPGDRSGSDILPAGMENGTQRGGLFGARVRPMMNLSVEDVRSYLDSQLERLNNKRLKIGSIDSQDNIITAEVVTLDNSLVQRLRVDRHTGRIEYVE